MCNVNNMSVHIENFLDFSLQYIWDFGVLVEFETFFVYFTAPLETSVFKFWGLK